MKDLIRYVLGYIIGIFIFIFLIPYSLIELSKSDPIIKADISSFQLIRYLISTPFFLVGLLFMIWSNISLFKIGKGGATDFFNIAVTPRTKKLVITGPYNYSRNPMVFGAFCLYFSIGLFMFSIICLLILMLFVLIVIKYLKITEEIRLYKDFGEEYIVYKNKVSMIFPVKRLREKT